MIRSRFKALGTLITITLDDGCPAALLDKAKAFIEQAEQEFSLHRGDSLLNRVNQAAGQSAIQVTDRLFDLINIGRQHSLLANTSLNIAIAPLTQLWRIGFSTASQPDLEDITSRLKLCNPQLIQLDEKKKTVFLSKTGMALDLGALAKGYIMDLLLDYLKQEGCSSALIDFGGNILTYGRPFDHRSKWRIGLQEPYAQRGRHFGYVTINTGAIATSGIYERYFENDGRHFHHILDSQSGAPLLTEQVSLTVLAPTGLESELWTSHLFGQDTSFILQLANLSPHLEVAILMQDKTLLLSDGLKKRFTPSYIP